MKGIGKEQVNKTVKFRVAYFAASILEWASWITNKEPSLTKYSVGFLSKTFTLDISKAIDLLNYNRIISTEESIEEFINWYNENESN